MRRRTDEIDKQRAAAYAWRISVPDEEPAEEKATPDEAATGPHAPRTAAGAPGEATAKTDPTQEAPGSDDDEGDDADDDDDAQDSAPSDADGERELQQLRADAHRAATALASAVDRAWALPPKAQAAQIEAAGELAMRAGRMGLQVAAMNAYPLQSVRFLRLVARHWESLPDEAREAAGGAAQWADYAHPEAADLVIEAVRTGDRRLNTALAMAIERGVAKDLTRSTNVSARLARVLDEGPTDAARLEAILHLHSFGRRDALPAIRRVLRRPHFGVRWRALQLLNDRFPDGLDAGDGAFLLEEAVSRAAPPYENIPGNLEGYFDYPTLLDRVLCRTRPPGGAASLVRILEGACPDGYRIGYLDGAWAAGVLGEAYPADAVPQIDRRLRRLEWDRRHLASLAAARLPDDLAWPRLLLLAEDPVPDLAEGARATWLSRRGEPCPVGELAGLEVGLLDGPPSERMLARLDVFRRGPLPARAAMAQVLLEEAPDPEALVLLAFAIGDSSLWERSGRGGIPSDRKAFVRALVQRFGAKGVSAVLGRAARHPDGRWGWIDSLSEVASGKDPVALPRESHAEVRAAAARQLAAAARIDVFVHGAMRLLSIVGPPPDAVERLCSVAWDPQAETYLRSVASAALAALPPAELGALTDTEIEAALAAADVPRLVRAAVAGLRAGSARAVQLAGEAFERAWLEPPEGPAITDAIDLCARELVAAGHLDPERVLAGLDAPGTRAFVVAARRLRLKAPPEAHPKLLAALEGDPVCAAAAAPALFFAHVIKATDPRLADIAARVPLQVRAALFWEMFYYEPPTPDLWPLIEEVLVSTDPDVTGEMWHRIDALLDAGMEDAIRGIESRIVDPDLLDDIERWRSTHRKKGTPYWEDAPDLASDDDDDDDLDELLDAADDEEV